MKISIFAKSLTLALIFCFGLIHAGHAQAPSYSVSVTTPSGPNDVNENTFYPYTATATLHYTGNLGELKIANERWSWTNSNTWYQYQSNQYRWVAAFPSTKFMTTGTPSVDSSHLNGTTIQIKFTGAGSYDITLTATDTFDLQNPDGTTAVANIVATGSADAQIQVAAPDFTLSDGDDLTIKLEDSGVTTVSASAIKGFGGDISLSLSPNATHNTGDPGPAPVGVSADSASITLPPSPSSTSMNIKVGATAAPGKYALTIFGDGRDTGGYSPTIEKYATVSLTIPRRYVEITNGNDGSGQNNSKIGPNNRKPQYDGSMTIDSVVQWRPDSTDPSDAGYRTGTWHGTWGLSPQNEQGFKSSKSYFWVPTFAGKDGGKSYPGFTPSDFKSASLALDDNITPVPAASQALGKNTNIALQVANSGSSFHSDNSYAIRWHYPYENWVPQGSGVLDNPSYEVYQGSGYVTSGESVDVIVDRPVSTITDNAGIIGSAVLGVAGAAVGTTPGAAIVGFSTPQSAVASTLLIALSYTVSAVTPTKPGPKSLPTGLENFKDSVLIQQQLTAHPGATYYVNANKDTALLFDPDAARFGSGTSSLTLTNTASSWYFTKVWAGAQGPVQVEVIPGRYRFLKTFVGDQYGSNGYMGLKTDTVRYPGSYDYVYHWKIGTVSPPPNK